MEHFLICSEGTKALKDYFFKRGSIFNLQNQNYHAYYRPPTKSVFKEITAEFSEKTIEFIFLIRKLYSCRRYYLGVWFDRFIYEYEVINCRTEGVYCKYEG